MKRAIWKFELKIEDEQDVVMPEGATVLTAQTQAGMPCLWALVNTEALQQRRTFCIFGTGHPVFDTELSYIGTVQQAGGRLVWHIFEKP